MIGHERYEEEFEQQKTARRMAILQAAKTLFLQSRIENIRMQDIADKANISRMTMYRYFPNKKPIAFEVAAMILKEYQAICMEGIEKSLNPIIQCITFNRNAVLNFDRLNNHLKLLGSFENTYLNSEESDEAFIDAFSTTYVNYAACDSKEDEIRYRNIVTTINELTMGFLGKLSRRTLFPIKTFEVPIEIHLRNYNEMLKNWERECEEL